jgi:ubiquinone/menaquinone biosynthesis C-methylase UbiE
MNPKEMSRLSDSHVAPHTRGHTLHGARWYDAVVGLLFLGKERRAREMTLDLAEVKRGDQVLDVGCGTGSLTIAASGRAGTNGEVHGIDAAPQMIEVARQKAERAGVDVDFQVGLIEDIPFPDDTFDLVLSSLMLHHLPHDLKREGFVEIYRVLKPGGRFLAVDFEPPTGSWFRHLATWFIGHGMMQSNLHALGGMMEAAGFTEMEVGATPYRTLAFLRGSAGRTA